MFHSKSLFSLAVLGLMAAVGVGAPAESFAANSAKSIHVKKGKQHRSRGLASLAPSARPMGQGEQMLYSFKDSNPRFAADRGSAKNQHVQLAGVCRDAFGMTFYSTDKGYSKCIDARTMNTSSVNSYFGGAQRQAGVGFVVR